MNLYTTEGGIVRRAAWLSIAALTLLLAPSAAASGPSLPAIDGGAGVEAMSGGVQYVTLAAGSATRLVVRANRGRDLLLRSANVPGAWGIPMVTFNGGTGGLSPDGHMLVLSDNVRPNGAPRTRSRFAVIRTKTLELTGTVSLRGDFSFDALSPQGGTLFLIQHVSRTDLTKYQVRAYDLRAGRLLPRVIADKRQEGWIMNGYPVSRATTANGRWVYTLYRQDDNYPFIHALDTVSRTAVCIGLPWQWTQHNVAISSATLQVKGHRLEVTAGHGGGVRFLLDTKTFRVSRP
jgi:hypothetical protein